MAAAIKNHPFFYLFFFFLSLLSLSTELQNPQQVSSPPEPPPSPGGEWVLLHQSIGISAMHMQLLNNNKVVIFDRTDFGPSNLSLPFGTCRFDPNDVALQTDCTAHSLIYDVSSNSFRPLMVQTDTWCSSGSVLPNGTLVQTGGYNDGDRVVRTLAPCNDFDQCDWTELPEYLSVRRWYSSNQLLPDGRIIIVGGRRVFNYEFFPRNPTGISQNPTSASSSSPVNYYLKFLQETKDVYDENNLYPFLHLLPDGNLFIFANKRSILFDYVGNRVLREYPEIPGQDKRNYPSTGSSVLLPIVLSHLEGTELPAAEVMVCGGAPTGSFYQAQHGVFIEASKTCGRLKVTDPNPEWVMEEMPMARVMPDMLLLPTGNVIILNGAANGTAGWESAMNPVLHPVMYRTNAKDSTQRFKVLNPTTIPRLYHSAAVLLADGRILVGGSNPHRLYNFTDVTYPTELSLEAFSPPYLADQYTNLRPRIISVGPSGNTLPYRQIFTVTFFLSMHPEKDLSVRLMAPSFTTHSFAMNQRLVVLRVVSLLQMSATGYQLSVIGPTTAAIAPPGYYLLFLVHKAVPSKGVWLKIE